MARSRTSRSPPIMNVSSPFSAPCLLPVTGASSQAAPFPALRQASLRLTLGLIVLESITMAPARRVSRIPPLPVTTSSTAAVSLTMIMTTSAWRAASAGLATTVAPAFSRASALLRVRLNVVTLCPVLTRFRAMGWPMMPRPTKPMDCAMRYLLKGSGPVAPPSRRLSLRRPASARAGRLAATAGKIPALLKRGATEVQPQAHVADVVVRESGLYRIAERTKEVIGIAGGEKLRRIKTKGAGARNRLPVGHRAADGAVAVATIGACAQDDSSLPLDSLRRVERECLIAAARSRSRHGADDFSTNH